MAKAKGEYDSRLKDIEALYSEDLDGYGGEGRAAALEKELVADLVGDYLFTDSAFVDRLYTGNRNAFEKAFDEVKYFCRMATAGSKEAKQLEKVKKAFEDAYRQDAKNTADDGGVRYSLSKNAKSELHKALYDKTYKGEVLLRDVTPGIMLLHDGVKNLPMTMNASHIRENVFTEEDAGKLGLKVDKHTHYHGLGEDFFLKVIDGLDNVKEAYRGTKNADEPSRRENYFLLVSEFLDQNGNTVNVPVYVNEHGQVNRAFIDVNKISTVFGRDNFRDYINRQIQQKNLVRIKNRSTQSSESNALIAKDYRQDASSDSIRENAVDVNQKLSLSSQEDMFPVRKDLRPGRIYGSDVELAPVRQDVQAQAETEERGEYDDLPFEMPEGIEQGQLTDEELEEDAKRRPVETVAQRLEVKFASLRQELRENEQQRQVSNDAYERKIEELQQRYEAKPNKHTKAANAIARQISRQKQLKAQRDAEFEKRIHDIQKKIDNTRELIKWDHSREDLLEKQLRQVDEKLEAGKMWE